RPRSHDEHTPWMCHLLAVHNADIDEISYETDRARFIGRDRDLAAPQALDAGCARLSGSEGSVLDPVVAIRCRITLEPEQSVVVDLVTGMAGSRAGCLQLIGKYRDRNLADRVFDLAWTHSQVLLRQLNASLADAQLYEHMATAIVYPNAQLRAGAGVLRANRRGQSGLWGQSISGDLPIVLLRTVDLVIWNEDRAGYRQELHDQIMGLITSGSEANLLDHGGGVFVRAAQQLSHEDRMVVEASARIVLSDSRGTLAEQVTHREMETHVAPLAPAPRRPPPALAAPAQPPASPEAGR